MQQPQQRQTSTSAIPNSSRSLVSSGALFRANPSHLKSPLPHHIAIQQQQSILHLQNGPSTQNLFRPQPVYGKVTSSSTINHSSIANDDDGFKIPLIPSTTTTMNNNIEANSSAVSAKNSVEDEFNIHDYLDFNNSGNITTTTTTTTTVTQQESVIAKNVEEVLIPPAVDCIRPIDDEIKSLVDSIHSQHVSQPSTASQKSSIIASSVDETPAVEAKTRTVIDETTPIQPIVPDQHVSSSNDTTESINKDVNKSLDAPEPLIEEKDDSIDEPLRTINESQQPTVKTTKCKSEKKDDLQVEEKKKSSLTQKYIERKKSLQKLAGKTYDVLPDLPKSAASFEKYCEKYPGIHFEKWWLIPLHYKDKDTLDVVIEGYRRMGKDSVRWHSSVIVDTKGSRCAISKSGNKYWLHGGLFGDEVPDDQQVLCDRFANGFFDGWKEFMRDLCKKWETEALSSEVDGKEVTENVDDSGKDKQQKVREMKQQVTKKVNYEAVETKKSHSVRESKHLVPNDTKKENRRTSAGAEHPKKIAQPVEHDVDARRHTIAAHVEDKRISFGRSRSGRKIKAPKEFWKATEMTDYLDADEPVITQVKLEWGTGRVKVIESVGRSMRSDKSEKPNVDSSSSSPDKLNSIAAAKRGRGRPRKLVPATEDNDDDGNVENESDTQEAPEKTEETATTTVVKRGRGRPRKSLQPQEELEEFADAGNEDDRSELPFESPEKPKKRRGRPRKSLVQRQEAEEEEEESDYDDLEDFIDDSAAMVIPKTKAELKKDTYYRAEETSGDEESDQEVDAEWTTKECEILRKLVTQYDPKDADFWENVADWLPNRTAKGCQSKFRSLVSTQSGQTKNKKHKEVAVSSKSAKTINSNSHVDPTADRKLAGKNTLLRKRQIRQMMDERAENHQDDLFGDNEEEDDQSRRQSVPLRNNRIPPSSTHKRKNVAVDEGQEFADSPEVLKPFNPKDTDGYIEAVKRQKLMRNVSSAGNRQLQKPISSKKKQMPSYKQQRQMYLKQRQVIPSSDNTEYDEDIRDGSEVEDENESAMQYYAEDSD